MGLGTMIIRDQILGNKTFHLNLQADVCFRNNHNFFGGGDYYDDDPSHNQPRDLQC